MLNPIGVETGLGSSDLSLLTLGPLVLIGLGAFLAQRIQTRIGARRATPIALCCIMAGSAARLISTAAVWSLQLCLLALAVPPVVKMPRALAAKLRG